MPDSLLTPIAPPWLIVPTASVLLIAVITHAAALRTGHMPDSRRRLRTVNAFLMMIAVPLTTYALCLLDPRDARWFVLTWAATIGVIGIVISVAFADILNTARIASNTKRALRTELRERLRQRISPDPLTSSPRCDDQHQTR